MTAFTTVLVTLLIVIVPLIIAWRLSEFRRSQGDITIKRCNAKDSEERRCRNYAGFSSRYCKEHGGWW